MNYERAVQLLTGLVQIPSLSRQEGAATAWLAEQMRALGYARAGVDEAGNAVGELGSPHDPVLMLLGHIDTVPGDIPVRIEGEAEAALLYGRGAVDAKGPLATFVAAAAAVGDTWARANRLRIVVVGAVEEEAATSKGARWIRDRFDGVTDPVPLACVIGEPSGWSRLTLGYKGRLLVDLDASQPMAHTAGPDTGVATVAVALWNWVEAYAASVNVAREKAFDQIQPSLRQLRTFTDEQMQDHVTAQVGIRLPLDFDEAAFLAGLRRWAGEQAGGDAAGEVEVRGHVGSPDGAPVEWLFAGRRQVELRLFAHEPAWRSDRSSPLVRTFLNAIRTFDPNAKPAFVVKTGTSDMNVVAPAWRCPILAYGPGDSSLDHTPNEHISPAEYWKSVQILEKAVRDFTSFL